MKYVIMKLLRVTKLPPSSKQKYIAEFKKDNGKINKCDYCGSIIKKDKKFEKILEESKGALNRLNQRLKKYKENNYED